MCAGDSILVGLQALQVKLAADCPDCVKYVFGMIGHAADQQTFLRFISRPPKFVDGTRSSFLMEKIAGDFATDDARSLYVSYFHSGTKVADVFAASQGITGLAYLQANNAQSPTGKRGLLIFLRPSGICTTSALSDSFCQISNQVLLWHEGLHEFYGISDSAIQRAFKLPVIDCTADIDLHIGTGVYNRNLHSCGQ